MLEEVYSDIVPAEHEEAEKYKESRPSSSQVRAASPALAGLSGYHASKIMNTGPACSSRGL